MTRPAGLGLAQKIGLLLLLPLLASLLGVAYFVYFLGQTRQTDSIINMAGRQRMRCAELGAWAQMVALGQDEDRAGLTSRVREFDDALTLLTRGADASDKDGAPELLAARGELAAVAASWSAVGPELLVVTKTPRRRPEFRRALERSRPGLAQLRQRSEDLVNAVEARSQALRLRVLWALGAAAALDCVSFLLGMLLTRRHILAPVLRVDEALTESERRFREIAENIEEVFWMTDPVKSRMLYVSPAYERIWGRSRESLYAKPQDWIDAVEPADRERVLAAALTKQVRGDYDEEYRIRRPSGAVRWIRDRAFPVRDDAGQVVRVVGVASDISERKASEARLRQTEKLSAIGQLAAGVAHELNNPLGVIMGFAQGLARRTGEGDPDKLAVASIERESRRCRNLVANLLSFSRASRLEERKRIDLRKLVAEALSLVAAQAKLGDVSVASSLGEEPLEVQTNADQIQQVVVNLCINAIDAMPRGGTLAVSLRRAPDAGGRRVELVVADTGAGIPDDIRSKVLEPFFTTKDPGKGTGLGLSLVHEIVQRHGGSLEFDSRVGQGTTFVVSLPEETPA